MNSDKQQQATPESAPWILTAGFPRTDSGNAERLVARHRDQIRYCPPRKRWLHWDGRRWAWDQIGHVDQLVKGTVRAIYVEAQHAKDEDEAAAIAKHAVLSEKRDRRVAMQVLAQTEPGIPVLPKELDADPWLFNVANGTIDLRTGQLCEHRRDELITKLAPVDYAPHAAHPLWNGFLKQLTGGDAGLEAYLQRVFGYALYGRVAEKKFWFLYGPPDGLKSTLLLAVSRTFGDYAHSANFGTWLVQTSTGGNRGDLVALMGARLVTSVETRKGARFDEEIIKKVTGGDPLVAAAKYEHEVTFEPSFALVLAANDAPVIREDDAGMWPRVQRVPCTHPLPLDRQDTTMPTQLSAPDVQQAILAWAVEGCRAWQQRGIGTCEAVTRSNASYRKAMDRTARFFEECCTFESGGETSNADIRIAYETWCADSGIKHPLSMIEVGKKLSDRKCTQCLIRRGVRGWAGVRLQATECDDPSDESEGDSCNSETDATEPPETSSRVGNVEKLSGTAVATVAGVADPCQTLRSVADVAALARYVAGDPATFDRLSLAVPANHDPLDRRPLLPCLVGDLVRWWRDHPDAYSRDAAQAGAEVAQ